MTASAQWKAMCRTMESKPFVRRFGTKPLRELGSFSIFEINSDQVFMDCPTPIEGVQYTVPPFPFPKIAMITDHAVVTLSQPEMDLDTSVLEYESMVYATRGEKQGDAADISFARIRVDTLASQAAKKFQIEALNLRTQTYDTNGVIDFPRRVRDRDTKLDSLSAEEREKADLLHEELIQIENNLFLAIKEGVQIHFIMSLLTIAWINMPKHYIVERAPEIAKPRKPDKDRAPRLGERARYIIIDHEDVRRRWTAAQGTHASPMPHLRRGHYKTLRAERYKEARGKTVWVAPCHVNGAVVEWRQDGVTYKVVG